ncbi:unnamed protein product [Penicillium egyptiacum]|uniref:Uncharacterized protein n=1 Tax=Penicillium egyptiacum TaxID=1303716 RepID=A0A9W4P102_9EURO|nr:unnamed protein product [Penicillium egyptiacum]
MLIAWLVFLFVEDSLASNSTALVSWQQEGNGRSAWDILWPCLTTIFACTWTILHFDVWPRNACYRWVWLLSLRAGIIAILAPEMVFWFAAAQRDYVKRLRKVCNAAQKERDNEVAEPKVWLSEHTRPLGQAHNLHHIDLVPVKTEWSLPQCFCIVSGGLAIQTQDEWIYTVRFTEMKAFIQAGILHCSDFRDQDIEDRAKVDPFAKGFAILQSTWFLCNIIARWASHLPVSPIELSTVAYVVCGVLIYAVYWHKPKNMSTSIKIHLHYTRATLPAEIHGLTESNPEGWVHLRARIKNEGWLSLTWRIIKSPLLRIEDPAGMIAKAEEEQNFLERAPSEDILFAVMTTFVASLFCAIHVAAWKYDFPSYAERISWRVFSLSSVAMVNIFSASNSMFYYAKYLESYGLLPPFMRVSTRPDGIAFRICLVASSHVYVIVRLGMTALVFSSLRALPMGSYTSIKWVTTIPHFS